MYGVDVMFRADGTRQRAARARRPSGRRRRRRTIGVDDDRPLKKRRINYFQASNKGVGGIHIAFDLKGVVRDELRNVKLMGDQLEFELFHMGQYGPVLLQLFRD